MKYKSRLAFDLLLKEMEQVNKEERLITLGGVGELYRYQTDPMTGQIQRYHSNSNGGSWYRDYGYDGGYDSNWGNGSSGGSTGGGGSTSTGAPGGIGFSSIIDAIKNGHAGNLPGGIYQNEGGNDWSFRPNNSNELYGKIEIPGVGSVYYGTDQTKEVHEYFFDKNTSNGSTGTVMLPEITVSASGVANYGPLQNFLNNYRVSVGDASYFDINKYNNDAANGLINANDVSYKKLVEVFGNGYYTGYYHYNSNGDIGGGDYGSSGYNSSGYNSAGYNSAGYNSMGFSVNGYNEEGYDQDGANSYGYSSNGVLLKGEGYDYRGYNSAGWDRNGYDSAGFKSDGYNSFGYHYEEVSNGGEMSDFLIMLKDKGLGESIKTFAPKLDSDFEKRLFDHYWYGDVPGTANDQGNVTPGTMTLTTNEFNEIKNAVSSISPIPDVSQGTMGVLGVNGTNYYIHAVSTYGNDTYDFGIGSALGIFLASGEMVGVYDNYNFNPGNRDFFPEAATRTINAVSPEIAKSFYISGGDYPDELKEFLKTLIP